MDIIDILGGLLRQKAGGAGTGLDILNDILKGQRRSQPAPSRDDIDPRDTATTAKELEDLLNVAHDRNARRTSEQQASPQPKTPPATTSARRDSPAPTRREAPAPTSPTDIASQSERALILIRSMVNAAKADGEISQAEQQSILQHVDASSPGTIQFLREEFAKPLDVRGFALSVPLGMEQDVYTLSLLTIDLDSNREASYLGELAQLLRISPAMRNQIHQRLGAPQIS